MRTPVLPERRRETPHPVEFSTAAYVAIFFVAAGVLGAFSGLPEWAVVAIALATARLIGVTGQWWYGRKLAR